jgi:putative aldouronate transport system permease protein
MSGVLAHGKVSYALIVILVGLSVLVSVLPIINIAAISFSSNSAILAGKVSFWPVELSTISYTSIFSDKNMTWSLVYTVMMTALYTSIAMVLTTITAYPLTKKRLKGRVFFLGMIVITMYFGGGLIPDYILMLNLGILDTIWCLVLPGALSTFNIIILKTFFADLPESFEESAIMDGAHDIQVLMKIVLPLSGPVLATLALFYAVGRWNGFMDALFYITKPRLYPLQFKLYQIIKQSTAIDIAAQEGNVIQTILPESLQAACIIFATVPILCIYPWLQKYFIKGVMIGGIKG